MQQQKACRDIFLAAVASDAVYGGDAHRSLQDDSRPEARLLRPVRTLGGAAHIFEAELGNTVVVAFRGTDNLTDVWTDMQYYQTDALPVDVHAGFYQQSLRVRLDELVAYLAEGRRLLVCGHSLGGAAAQLLVLRLFNEGRLAAQYRASQRVQCITFGAPLAAAAVPGYEQHVFLNFVNENDLVPKLLLLKREVVGGLRGILAKSGLRSMLEGLASQAYLASPWYLQLAATFGQGFLDAYWSSESETFPYTPFGYFIFLAADGDSHTVRLASGSSKDVKRILRTPETLASLSGFRQALRDHRIANYGEALERIRMGSLSKRQNPNGDGEGSCHADAHHQSLAPGDPSFFEGARVVGFGNLVSFPAAGMLLNRTTVDWLASLEGPFYSVVCAGQGRSGKSLLLSLVAGSEGLFPSSDAARPVTEGLDLAVIRVRGGHALLFDAEGGDNALARFHAVVNVMGLLLGQVLVWVTGGTITESAINLLGQMIASSALISHHGDEHKSVLFFVANKCTLRFTASDFEESLSTFDGEAPRAHARSAIQGRFPPARRSFFRLPLLHDGDFAEEFAELLGRVGGSLAKMSPLAIDGFQLDGQGVSTFIQMIFDSVRDMGNVDMPSVVESVILNGYLIPQAKQSLSDFVVQLPQLGPHGTCVADASLHDSRESVLAKYATTVQAKLPQHTNMTADAQGWLRNELERAWIAWQANNTIARHDATSNLASTTTSLARRFEEGLPKISDYQHDLSHYDNRDWLLQQYDAITGAVVSCLGPEIRDSRLTLSQQLGALWAHFGDLNKALGQQLLEEETEERKILIDDYKVLCGCRRRRRHYKPKKTFSLQERSKYTHKDGTTSYSSFNEGRTVHEYPHGDCGNHPEAAR